MSSSRSTRPSSQKPHPRVALVCDWLTTPGGAEKVLLELHRMYPDAPIYTSQYSKKGINWFDDAEVRTGWLQIFPKSLRKFLGPLRQLYFSHLDLSDYNVVISVTGAEAKAVKTQKSPQKHSNLPLYHTSRKKSIAATAPTPTGAYHFCYCHVPTQYYWQMYDKYLQNPGFGFLNPLVRLALKLLVKPLRQADYQSAQRPDQFVTISAYAKQQIKQYYHRDSVIIAPPVEVAKFFHSFSTAKSDFSTKKPALIHQKSIESQTFSTAFPQGSTKFSTDTSANPTNTAIQANPTPPAGQANSTAPTNSPRRATPYFIIACRQVTWKRVDLAIKACKKLHLHLKVVGDGSEHRNLVRLAANSQYIEFVPWAGTRELANLLQNAEAYLFPSLEPFGVAAVEALAAGCPVIAYAEGGSRDFITNRINGLLFPKQTTTSLVEALQNFRTLTFDRAQIAKSATKFDAQNFRQKIEQQLRKVQNL